MKSVLSFVTRASALNMTLPAFVVDSGRLQEIGPYPSIAGTRRRRPQLSNRLICPQGTQHHTSHTLLLSGDVDRYDKQTDTRPLYILYSAYYAGNVNNSTGCNL